VREYRRHVSFVMFERSNARAFTAGELLRAKRCVRHLATAMKVTQHCEDMKTDAAVGHRLLHGSSRPMLLLGRDREILACNPAGRALLAQGNVIHADGGVLKCRLPDNETALSKLLERFVNPARPKSERRNRAAVKLRDANGAAILCSVANMASDENAVTPPVDVVALLSFASLHVPETQTDPEILASLYGFSKAELRLVSALLRGENLFQIAARNCVTLATVRSQLRSVFAKTNTHRQAEVIQLLLVALLL
jgi:DNA-binding CsgD family transcriptional regulator